MKPILFVFLTVVILSACGNGPSTDANDNTEMAGPVTPDIKYKEVDYFLHDTSLFTEGLLIHDGQLFESTGSPDKGRKSLIGINDLNTGHFIKKVQLAHSDLIPCSEKALYFLRTGFTSLPTKTTSDLFTMLPLIKRSDSSPLKKKAGDSPPMEKR